MTRCNGRDVDEVSLYMKKIGAYLCDDQGMRYVDDDSPPNECPGMDIW